ncbi:MAG: DNA-binding transcriptional regulator [Gordonia sp.]|uniref:helix-turn-helix transcriptional regulator n=1 Tax=Gordonia sp. (in: high G+C Gram-positive bacteria) TaxID=84139 RepID=UPI000C55F2C7|nr:YafY family protein [Gordonia sp. (in: high G+C Gram-positive bacteria)]MAU84296.1 DNA-binding transcriptional regulator [Gordonia sp. (in: high G+C Gram-positive bacteria)]MAU84802.1 DNA-binding transcriptional regulator [Gordonia sp. (in: high G+C Gram-positive bacteria)]
MLETSARLLALLSLLQTRREWSGSELADRLHITTRTVRRDIDKLRELGYPVDATVGVGGGYRLGAGAEMPPLLLDDQEVLAVALGLNEITTGSVSDMAEASAGALAKLRQVMPSRLRHRLDALTMEAVPRETRNPVSGETLTDIATACHRTERLRFDYRRGDGTESRREVEPYRLVRSGLRWYLIGWDLGRDDWRSFRVDRMEPKTPTGPRFVPRELPEGGATGYLSRSLGAVYRRASARVRVHAPLATVAAMVHDEWGTIEAGDENSCELVLFSTSLVSIARWLRAFDADFTILEPPELIDECRAVARYHDDVAARYLRAADAAERS